MKKPPTIKMCCNLQNHTKVIALISLLSALLGFKDTISQIGFAGDSNVAESKTTALVSVLCSTVWVLAVCLCLHGAIKRKRFFLIPFMVGLSIAILICSLSLLVIISGNTADMLEMQEAEMFALKVVSFILLGLSVYFLVIVAMFYKELASEMNDRQREGMALESLRTDQGSKMYVPPESQNLMCQGIDEQVPCCRVD